MKPEFIFDWLSTALSDYDGQHIIRALQNGPIPNGDYITYSLLSVISPDYDIIVKEQIAGDSDHILQTVLSNVKLIFDINSYSNTGYQILEELKLTPHLWGCRRVLNQNNITLAGKGATRNLTYLGDTTYKPRYQAEFTFRANARLEELIDVINYWNIKGELENDQVEVEV